MNSDANKRPGVSTGMGDAGQTMLYGGAFVPKDSPRIHAYGTVDELNAVLGVVLCEKMDADIRVRLTAVQRMLFRIGADLATPYTVQSAKVERITKQDIEALESWGVALEQTVEPLRWFILPGGSRAGAFLHLARTVCRRAERLVVTLSQSEQTNEHVIVYLNRLSDTLFLLSRSLNAAEGAEEERV